jgi:signal transduction histidine kinase
VQPYKNGSRAEAVHPNCLPKIVRQRKLEIMNTQDLLEKIRPAWLHRVAHSMARGADVRANFEKELEQFFLLLEQAVATGDPAWLDPILLEWASSPTQSDLEQGKNNVSLLFSKMIAVTNEVTREILTEAQALDLVTELIPIYTHLLDKAARLEIETRIAYISKELVSVQQLLERLDHTKSNFISVAAHELKTPLTLIEGYTTMMRDMIEESGQSQFDGLLVGMNKGVSRLREIIDDMIDVSLIDNNLLSLNFQKVTLMHILNLLKGELAASVMERKQKLEIKNFDGSDTWLYVDSERLYQALRNVLFNAIKYTPDKGKISVDGRTLPGFIEVIVKDTGIGIAAEHQTDIFEKFSQVGRPNLHSSGKTKFKGGGPGLGLPIARGIIEAHGGTIWVESEGYDEKKCPGSTFHILIPIRTESADPKIAKLFPQDLVNTEELHG